MTAPPIDPRPPHRGPARPLRIAVWNNLHSGGGKRALHDHVRGLQGRGHTIESWCFDTADRGYMPLAELAPEHVVPLKADLEAAEAHQHDGRIGRIVAPYRQSRAQRAAVDAAARRCAQEIDAGGFDLAFLGPCVIEFAPSVARHLRTPAVLYLQEPNRRIHEAQPLKCEAPPWFAWPRPAPAGRPTLLGRKRELGLLAYELSHAHGVRVQARTELDNALACRRILCNSLYSREVILRCYGLEPRVCYLGIDTSAFRPTDAPKLPYVVGLGSFTPNKRVDRALQALATIDAAQRPELVWVGNMTDESYLARAHDLASSLGVRLDHRRMVSQEELIGLLGRASVMLYTSFLEPFGYAPLEANACGTAVVGIAEGGIRETVRTGANGILVDPGDPAALGRAVLAYTSDPGRARADGLRAREHVEAEWGLASSIDRIERQLLDTAADPRPIGRADGILTREAAGPAR